MAGYSSASWAKWCARNGCITKDTPPPFDLPSTTSGYTPQEKPRLYYDCPLAAAYMAKHFGMKLLAESSDEGRLVDAGARFIDCDDTFRELWQHDFSYLGKLYVHPGSVALLEPQVGDVVIAEVHGPVRIANFAEFKGRKTIESVSDCYGGGSFYPEAVTSIIQRNGMAFFWPEQEAA